MKLRRLAKNALRDLQDGKHREAYSLLLIGGLLAALGLLGVASEKILLSSLLIASTYLVFQAKIAVPTANINDCLMDRSEYSQLSSVLAEAEQLWVYGPTAVNVVINSADIRRHILAKGGEVRVVVQDPDSPSVGDTMTQLDDNLDFKMTLANTLAVLTKMQAWGDLTYRVLPFNPGFSMLVINGRRRDGYLVVEFHGFADDNIADRMHVTIPRADSPRWFDYWSQRFEEIWKAANPAGGTNQQ
ncbi:hypothetical protein ABZS35_02320 [Micromonospora sp. NPDC005599]|uniref:hypothetical protein n=1 Tax=Micromonospora sp. NPDC005599 TaxID=3155715 RepID=UPI0033ABA037